MKKKSTKKQTKKIAKNKSKISKKPKRLEVPEEEFLQVLDNISKRLAHKFRFAYHDVEDMKQQAAIFAIEGLEKYDHKRPLENFLWTHVRNRLFNYKRNNYQRPDNPCLSCEFYDKNRLKSTNQCARFTDKEECPLHTAWNKRNSVKKNIVQPSYIPDESLLDSKDNFSMLMQNKEIVDFLDINIQSEYRESYLKLKHGLKINKQQLEKLKKHITFIIKEIKGNND